MVYALLVGTAGVICSWVQAQQAPAQEQTSKADAEVVGDEDMPPEQLPEHLTPAQRNEQAWKMLSDALDDSKHLQNQIQALAALGILRGPRSEKMLTDAMNDPDMDVRTAAALAAGQTMDRNLTTPLRNLLDDKEPEVVFTAATTLWKMGDRSGEDVLMSVVDGDRSTNPGLVHGTEHKISRDLHDPAKLAKLGAIQGAYMLAGPFGYGITAFQFLHQTGGNAARVAAIEQISQERTAPIHKDLMGALEDKDPTVRAAAAKALVDYHDKETSNAIYALFVDPKNPVRLQAAAAYLRTTGTPGPPVVRISAISSRREQGNRMK